MEHEEIVEYLTSGLKRGLGLEEIRNDLFSKGVADYDINKAIKEAGIDEKPDIKPEVVEKPTAESIKDWDSDLE